MNKKPNVLGRGIRKNDTKSGSENALLKEFLLKKKDTPLNNLEIE